MSGRTMRILEALGGAAVLLLVVRWLDSDVISGIQRRAGVDFDPGPAAIASSLGYLMVAAGALLIVLLARRSVELLVGVLYAIGGAFLAFLFPLTWFLTAAKGNSPAILTGPLADLLDRIWTKAEQGPLNSVAILGAVMFLVGLVTIVSAIRQRRTPASLAPLSPLGVQASSR
jgi:hypothetical protein